MTTVAKFNVDYFQYLDENGKVVNELPAFAQNTDTLIELYQWMVRTRTFDNKAVILQRTGKMGTFASVLGQEAISVAIGHAMQKDDVLCPAYREYGAMLQRGVRMADILLYWGGDERGSDYAENPYDFPICVPIATQCLHAAGVAKAMKFRKQKRAAISVIGDGGTSQGDFYEAMNVCGEWDLPAVFIINNNQWAISIPRGDQTNTQTLAQKGIAAEINTIQVDGNDMIATYDAINTALNNAREGKGATVIEAVTYRLGDHTTADDATRYRPDEEVKEAWTKEPILRLRNYLIDQGVWDDQKEQQLLDESAELVEAAVKDYLETPAPAPESMFDYLFAELPQQLVEQREKAIAYGGKK